MCPEQVASEIVTLHVVPLSHPCMTVMAALEHKVLEYEEISFNPGWEHAEKIEEIYGEGRHTVPGIVIDGQPVHGSVSILEHLEKTVPENPLYPEAIAAEVSAAERWGDEVFQELARSLPDRSRLAHGRGSPTGVISQAPDDPG
jgi:glutathione S-transferase